MRVTSCIMVMVVSHLKAISHSELGGNMVKKIFIINLPRSQDRKKTLLHELSQIIDDTITFEFFDGVDGNSSEVKKFSNNYNSLLTKCYIGRGLTMGERGCFASHYCLWQKCVELNEAIIVLEDDVKILKGFAEGVDRIYRSDYEYVRLMMLNERGIYALDEHFALTYSHVLGTQGYYLTPKAAKKFLASAKLWRWGVDHFMDETHIHKVPNIIHIPSLLERNTDHVSLIGKRKYRHWDLFRLPRFCLGAIEKCRRLQYAKSNKRKMRLS